MYLHTLARGFIIGFIIGMPMGPVGALIIQRLLVKGKKSGLISGLGSTAADMLYAILAAFGLTFINNFLIENKGIIQIVGGFIVFFIGIKIFYTKTSNKVGSDKKYNIAGEFTSTFILCFSNPMTIISSIALLAGIGIHDKNDFIIFIYLLIGIFVGAFIWWVLLTIGVSLIKTKISPESIPALNKFFGVMVSLLGIYIALTRLLKINLKYLP